MSDVAVAYQMTAKKFERERDAALVALEKFWRTYREQEDLMGGDFRYTAAATDAYNVLRHCGKVQ